MNSSLFPFTPSSVCPVGPRMEAVQEPSFLQRTQVEQRVSPLLPSAGHNRSLRILQFPRPIYQPPSRSCFGSSLIPWCKKMKTQLCDLYRHCFLMEAGPCDPPQRLSPGLQERAQAMVQCVSLPLLLFFHSSVAKSSRRVVLLHSTHSSLAFSFPQRETDGLEGFSAGEEQEERHHGVISCSIIHFLLSHTYT